MADSKLSALPTGGAIADADLFYSDQSASSVKQPATALATYMAAKNPAAPPAITYYISAVGSDSNNGTSPNTPWQTITKVNSVTPNPGTTFLFRGGDTFSGTIIVKAGGQPGLPVTYSSYGIGQATISSGNNSGLTCTDFGNITITNLVFVGSTIAANTTHGIFFTGANANCQNFVLSNLTVSFYGFIGIFFTVGNATPIFWSNISTTNCTVHDCGQNGIQHATTNSQLTTVPFFAAYNNVTVTGCTVYNCTGQNSIFGPSSNAGFGILAQGVNGFTVQNCVVHDTNLVGSGILPSPGIYTASANNVLFQYNEVYRVHNLSNSGGHDGGGLLVDFGCTNVVVQYNYLHDNWSYGCGTGTLTIAGTHNNNNNITFRYNVLANNGTIVPNYNLPIGMVIYTLASGETMSNLFVYNNTIIAKGGITSTNYAVFDSQLGHAGTITGVVANNIFYGDGDTILLAYWDNGLRFIGNDYVGGSLTKKILYSSVNYASVSAWLAATTILQEAVDGASVAITAGLDPVLSGSIPIQSPIAGGYVPGRVSNFQLAANSPVANLGLDLTSILPYQTAVPQDPVAVDFDFKGATYVGDVIGSVTCSRTATSGTDLLPTSPLGASFNTFAANTLRITSGKGLLIEEARTQFLATPGAPATQTTAALTNGNSYILWVNGTGNATLTAGSGTFTTATGNAVAVQGKPVSFTMSSGGTVTVTVNGTLNQFQLENDPAGVGLPTSFISAIGTRDADVVTASNANPIGALLQRFLGGGAGSDTGYALFFFNIPIGVQFLSYGVLAEDSNSLSDIALQAYGAAFGDIHVRGQMNIGGVTITTSNDMLFNTRQAIGGRSDFTNGQSLVLNGGTIALSASTATPGVGNTIYLGNKNGGGLALNGYIERIITNHSSNPISNAQLQTNTSTVPIGTGILTDFYGNQVPNSSGAYSIGAHQPSTATDFYGSPASTVAGLPSATAALKGARRWVSDANATFTAGIGATVAGGGTNVVPVFCDGTNWRIG